MKKLESLSIFFPCLNDGEIMPELIEKAYAVAPLIAFDFEIMVIDDGSDDYTLQVLHKLKHQYKNLRILYHKKNRGYGGALASGFQHAKKEWVFYTDGDGQYDVNELPKFVEKVADTIDVVNGFKLERKDDVIRKFVGVLHNAVAHALFSLPISDIDCDFRLMRRSVLRKIRLYKTSGTICLELIVKLHEAGARFTEVGVRHYERPFGHSQFFTPKKVFQTVIDHVEFYFSWVMARRRFTRSSTGG